MKRTLSILLATLVAVASVSGLVGCRYSFVTGDAYDEEGYLVGSKTYAEQVTAVEIVWKCGKLTVKNGDKVAVSENADGLSDEQRVRSVVRDGVLYVQFWKSSYVSEINQADKNVLVEVPRGASIKIASTSGDIHCEDISADSFEVGKMSGGFYAGDIVAKSVRLSSTSGSIKTDSVSCDSLSVSTTSGKVSLGNVAAVQAQVNSTSGNVSFNIMPACEQVDVECTSGSVKLCLQDVARGAAATINTTSGAKNVTVEHTQSGNEYVVGSGACKLYVRCTSGSVTLVSVN